ncbi:unnamed protein product [Penicillium salamii]|nr:unnamed protein product [Penicillium salamii]CAG8288903.1 unnamed protein product [Penicillium salamii]
MSLGACRSCHNSKFRCTCEVPHCQTCVKRGKCSMCVYEASVLDRKRVSDRKPALPEPQPKRQLQKQERASGENHIRWRAIEPRTEQSLRHEKSTNEKLQHAIEPTKEVDNKDLDQRYSWKDDLTAHETPPRSIVTTIAEKASIFQPGYGRIAVEAIFEWPQSTLVSQSTELYAQMNPPVINTNMREDKTTRLTVAKSSLPPRPNFDLTISGRHKCRSHTTNQLLLVLSYLFISSMLPLDLGALSKVICRRDCDWEESFFLQHIPPQRWLISARNALTMSDGLHTITLEDIELQTRYILFNLGQHTSPHSGLLAGCLQIQYPPYRPFGVRASVALICHVFGGILVDEMEGYELKEIWTRDQNFLIMMAFRLKDSPLFSHEVSMPYLKSMLLSLQRAFQCEEIRVSSTKVWTLRVESQSEVLGYYRRAFLAFDPMLLPKILASLSKASDITYRTGQNQLTNMEDYLDRTNLALWLAKIFTSLAPERLDDAFQSIREIQLSKADKVVAMEMMHVKRFEEAYKLNATSPPTIRMFHVSP